VAETSADFSNNFVCCGVIVPHIGQNCSAAKFVEAPWVMFNSLNFIQCTLAARHQFHQQLNPALLKPDNEHIAVESILSLKDCCLN
jgi:hypothetical protein